MYLDDYEKNTLIYSQALIYDKRTYFQYYFSLIRTKHMIIFAFYPNNDYNSQIIKVSLFFFSFNLYYTINALFLNEGTIHEIHENYGNFNFLFQLPKIIYSTIISIFINTVIKFLSLSEKLILSIKKEQNITNYKHLIPYVIRCLKIKFFIYYLLSFLFLVLFWFYLSCFCAIYKNTQIYLIQDTLISFGLSLLYPFVINLVPGILRIRALKALKKDRELMYEISKIIQLF